MKYLWMSIVLCLVGCAGQESHFPVEADLAQAEGSAQALNLPEGLLFMRNRAGFLRVRGAGLRENGVAERLARLARDAEDREVRLALAEAMGRTTEGRGEIALAWLTEESDPHVQSTLLHVLRRAPSPVAEQAVSFALTSASPEVRVAGLTAMGHFEPSQALLAAAAGGAQDVSGDVRAAALTVLQVHQAAVYLDTVVEGLSDGAPQVRAAAVRAMTALAPERLLDPEVAGRLRIDDAPAVQRALQSSPLSP